MLDQDPFLSIDGGTAQKRQKKRPRIAVTLGDPNGVGPEVVLKCLADSRLMKFVKPLLVGSAHVLKVHANTMGYRDLLIHVVQQAPERLPEGGLTVLDTAKGDKPRVEFGQVPKDAGRLAMKAVEQDSGRRVAAADFNSGEVGRNQRNGDSQVLLIAQQVIRIRQPTWP